jgi:ABC-type sugar transport system ATPase subunit
MAHIDNMGDGVFLDTHYEKERCNKWIKDINIKASSLDTEVNHLSGGNQQKIVLAKLLETGSRIFLMNEPTRGIDVGAKSEIYALMEQLCEAGAGIIMISSEMPEMLSMADRILVVSEGRITAEYDSEDADQEKLLSAATI